MNRNLFITLLLVLTFGTISQVGGFDNISSHPKITDEAIKASQLNLDLRGLGLFSGIKTVINYDGSAVQTDFGTITTMYTSTIQDLIRSGSYSEDVPDCRATNHFLNPLKSWDSAGMTDQPVLINLLCSSGSPWVSNVLWATQDNRNDFVWAKIRSAYYQALTATTDQIRSNNFAATFYGLGSLLHLLQDTAVPAHVRNDFMAHWKPGYEDFEYYVKYKLDSMPAGVKPTYFNGLPSAFWDSNMYDGSNPDVTAASWIGLAEFTNANFLSRSTIFTEALYPNNIHGFPYPRAAGTQLIEEVTPNGGKATYISKPYDGKAVTHLARASRFYKKLASEPAAQRLEVTLDDKCHADYAQLLLPKAVGYSAALLDNFFRGKIEISLPDSGVYLKTDDANPEAGFIPQVKLRVENKSPNGQAMTDGSIELVVKYRKAQSDPFHNGGVPVDNEYAYIVVPVANGVRTIPFTTPVELTFNIPQPDPEHPDRPVIPIHAVDVHLQVVYKGKLGSVDNAEDNAVAVGYKHVSPSTPVDLFNNMDKICISGMWFDAGSAAAIAKVDTDKNGIANEYDVYAHNTANTYVRISPKDRPVNVSSSDYTIKVNSIAGGQLKRSGYVITDKEFNWSMRSDVVGTSQDDTWDEMMKLMPAESRLAPEFRFSQYSKPEDCAAYGSTAAACTICKEDFQRFRSKEMWGGAGVIFVNQEVPVGMTCNYDQLD